MFHLKIATHTQSRDDDANHKSLCSASCPQIQEVAREQKPHHTTKPTPHDAKKYILGTVLIE